MPHAFVHLPDAVHYRREAFVAGFARLGYTVHIGTPDHVLSEHDAVVVWNMTARSQAAVNAAKAAGAPLIVAENGYFGVDRNGHQSYAMALDGHNGSGRWHAPSDTRRLERLGLDFAPYVLGKMDRVLIADQRGIGSQLMRSPPFFADNLAPKLRRWSGAEVRIRSHPGRNAPVRTLDEDLEWADVLVVWSSNCASQALRLGIPTFFAAPHIVTAGAAVPLTPDCAGSFDEASRWTVFSRAAWAQWFLDEIESGEAMRTLIETHRGHLPAVKMASVR